MARFKLKRKNFALGAVGKIALGAGAVGAGAYGISKLNRQNVGGLSIAPSAASELLSGGENSAKKMEFS